jgi:hypothetical protein
MAREGTTPNTAPELTPAADIVSRFIALSARLSVGAKQAEAMALELQTYGRRTESLRASLTPADQPANFAAVLSAQLPSAKGGVR